MISQQPDGTFIIDNDWRPGPTSCPDCGCHIVQLFSGQTCQQCWEAEHPEVAEAVRRAKDDLNLVVFG